MNTYYVIMVIILEAKQWYHPCQCVSLTQSTAKSRTMKFSLNSSDGKTWYSFHSLFNPPKDSPVLSQTAILIPPLAVRRYCFLNGMMTTQMQITKTEMLLLHKAYLLEKNTAFHNLVKLPINTVFIMDYKHIYKILWGTHNAL